MALLTLRAGIAFDLDRSTGTRQQAHFHAAAFDREIPTGADRIPVQLVVVGEETQLAGGAVVQGCR